MQVYAKGNLPGSWHDADLTRDLATILRRDEHHPPPFCLAGDSAFPAGKDMLGRIRCVLKLDSKFVQHKLSQMSSEERHTAMQMHASLTSVSTRCANSEYGVAASRVAVPVCRLLSHGACHGVYEILPVGVCVCHGASVRQP